MSKYNGMIQAVLTEESQKKLLEAVPPVHKNVHAHHVTVAYKPDMDSDIFKEYQDGQKVTVTIGFHISDEKGQAVMITGVRSNNDQAHVTISCADDVPPAYSNELLHKPWGDHVEPCQDLEAFIKFVEFGKKKER